MRKLMIGAAFLILCFSCERKEIPKSKNYKIAMMLPGAKNDGSWSEVGFDSGELVSKNLNSEVKYYENVKSENREEILNRISEDKNDLIIVHGAEFLDLTQKIADKYPNNKYLTTTK